MAAGQNLRGGGSGRDQQAPPRAGSRHRRAGEELLAAAARALGQEGGAGQVELLAAARADVLARPDQIAGVEEGDAAYPRRLVPVGAARAVPLAMKVQRSDRKV